MSTAKNAGGEGSETRHIGIVLFDGVEELDAVGPWEVLAGWTHESPEDGWSVTCLSHDGGKVLAAKGLELGAHYSFDSAPRLEVLIHPGGRGTERLIQDTAYLNVMRHYRAEVRLMTSVCTGSLVYAAAGLLSGRRATTYWSQLDRLNELDPTVTPDADARFVDEGDVITSAGVSAGIDMALHLVARLVDPERARQVRKSIQYDPSPPAGPPRCSAPPEI